mmetsp:Transcript_20692/g.38548  ORF Transcript_20692/g.38548 Transcript_20692/m.38548 type:complete len:229 (-) Transcript_20692:107-793(-)
MEQRTNHCCTLHLSQLPPPDLVASQKEKIVRTLQLVVEKQADLESRIAALFSKVEAMTTEKSKTMPETLAISPMNFLDPGKSSLPFSLKLVEPILTPLCKNRYFMLKVKLEGPVPLPCNLRVEVLAYSSDTSPQAIERNMTGGPFFRGDQLATLQCDLQYKTWEACLKLQVSEVSSHFPNGWVYLVVQPRDSKYIPIVKPLVLDKIVIKAKEKTCKRWRSRSRSSWFH